MGSILVPVLNTRQPPSCHFLWARHYLSPVLLPPVLKGGFSNNVFPILFLSLVTGQLPLTDPTEGLTKSVGISEQFLHDIL